MGVRRWVGLGLIVVLSGLAMFVSFRQGWVPVRYSPLPVLDLDRPLPFVTDWQLVELGNDRGLCERAISQSDKIAARLVPDRAIRDGCGWRNAVRTSSFGRARFPAARMTCPVAAAMALWVAYDVQPLARRIFGQEVVEIDNMGVYSCRRIIGSRFWKNRMSEHATANAVDIGAFKLADGTEISVLNDWSRPGRKSEFLRAVHLAACRYFRVALSPDFNAAHRDHFHFDRGPLYTCR
jgi:hypothetical protein